MVVKLEKRVTSLFKRFKDISKRQRKYAQLLVLQAICSKKREDGPISPYILSQDVPETLHCGPLPIGHGTFGSPIRYPVYKIFTLRVKTVVLTYKWLLDIKQRKTSLQFTIPENLENKEDPKRDI